MSAPALWIHSWSRLAVQLVAGLMCSHVYFGAAGGGMTSLGLRGAKVDADCRGSVRWLIGIGPARITVVGRTVERHATVLVAS